MSKNFFLFNNTSVLSNDWWQFDYDNSLRTFKNTFSVSTWVYNNSDKLKMPDDIHSMASKHCLHVHNFAGTDIEKCSKRKGKSVWRKRNWCNIQCFPYDAKLRRDYWTKQNSVI